MGLFDKIFGHAPKPSPYQDEGYFKTFTAYAPTFTTWGGQIYESELVRAAIDAKARHISKLKVEVLGSAKPKLQARLRRAPNEFQTWGQFLYRLATILEVQNTAFIVPVFGEYMEITGYYPLLPSMCELVKYNDEPWIEYTFQSGETAAIRVAEVGIMTKFQYQDDFFGSTNAALRDTMNLLLIQKQGITEAVKNSATYRFMAKLNNFSKPEDLAKERQRFSAQNLAGDVAGGGLLLFPNTYTEIQQIHQSAFNVDTDQMKLIQTNVYNYFGVNERILQNIATGDEWASFYEGCVEVFAIQFSDVMDRLTFSQRELAEGNKIFASANRLQYMSNQDKLNVSAQMADRGIMSINEIRDIWNLPPVDGGDIRIMRGEYKNSTEEENNEQST